MPFEKGREKTGGRRKSAKNKKTELEERMAKAVADNFEDFMQAYSELDPDRKCAIFLKMIEYVLPKKAAEKPEDEQGTTNASDLLRNRSEYTESDT